MANVSRNAKSVWGTPLTLGCVGAAGAVMTREDRTKGFFVAFDYTSDALREIDGFFRRH